MKLYFKKIIVFICLLFCNQVFGKEIESTTYIIEVGKINIGILNWQASTLNNKYEVKIWLKDKGFISGLYRFRGEYSSEGSVEGGVFLPLVYNQFWSTKKKERVIKIDFDDNLLKKLTVLPEEKEPARVSYHGIENYTDPLTSFLKIIRGERIAKTIDGRRMYKMVVEEIKKSEDTLIKKILIKNYINIWADHNKNDLNYIEVYQSSDEKNELMPEIIKIKFKGVVFSLSKN